MEFFNEVIKNKPDHVNATHNLAYALIEMGNPREAKKLLNKVITMKPDHTDALYNLGNVHKHLGEFYEAENYHQNYYKNNKNAPYCRAVIKPKLDKFLNNNY